MEEFKTCKICNRELPKDSKYFEPRKDSKDGFLNQCRDCLNKRRRERYVKRGTRFWSIYEYSEEELNIIVEKVMLFHKNNLGILLSEDCHKEFHHLYGSHNNTYEQLLDYKELYKCR